MSHLTFPEDSWGAFLHAFSSWLSLLSCSTSKFCGNLQKKDLLSVIRRPALSNPLAVRSAVSGCRGLQVTLVRTAEARVAQVGCCPLIIPSPSRGWLGHILASHASSIPVKQRCQLAQEHEAEPSAYKVWESPSWLRGLPVKAFNLQNLSPTMHSLLLIHITCVRPHSWRVSFLLGGDELMHLLDTVLSFRNPEKH